MTIHPENYGNLFCREVRAPPNNLRDLGQSNVALPMLITVYATNLLQMQ